MLTTLPPGPRTSAIYNLLHYLVCPDRFFANAQSRFGWNFTADLAGLGRFVFLGEPAAIRDVFLGDPETLRTGEANAFAVELLGPSSVLTLDGEEHARQRKALTPPFLAQHVNAYASTLHELARDQINRWRIGTQVKLEDVCREISLQAILRLVFGTQPQAELDALAVELRKLTHFLSHPLMFAAPLLSRLRPIGRFKQAVDTAVYRLIESRRASVADDRDVLAHAIGMRRPDGTSFSDEELRDHVVTLLLAGHDTTAIALAWALTEILPRTDILNRIRAELDDVVGNGELDMAHIGKLAYLNAAINESLRLRPLVDYAVRYLETPFTAGGVTYPAGITLAPCMLLVHRHPDIYPEPQLFKPERFLGVQPDPYAWIPFGGGRRRCLGIKFALLEMRVVLATILRTVQFAARTRPAPRVQRRGLFLAPSDRATFTPVAIKRIASVTR